MLRIRPKAGATSPFCVLIFAKSVKEARVGFIPLGGPYGLVLQDRSNQAEHEVDRYSGCPIVFSPDGRVVASGSGWGKVSLWGVPP